jgi:hypothetical protein
MVQFFYRSANKGAVRNFEVGAQLGQMKFCVVKELRKTPIFVIAVFICRKRYNMVLLNISVKQATHLKSKCNQIWNVRHYILFHGRYEPIHYELLTAPCN